MCPRWGAMLQRLNPLGESDSFLRTILYQMTNTHFSLYLENETQFPLRDAVGFCCYDVMWGVWCVKSSKCLVGADTKYI